MTQATSLGFQSMPMTSPLVAVDSVFQGIRSDLRSLEKRAAMERRMVPIEHLKDPQDPSRWAAYTYAGRLVDLTKFLKQDVKAKARLGQTLVDQVKQEKIVPLVLDSESRTRRLPFEKEHLTGSLRYFLQPKGEVVNGLDLIGTSVTYHLTPTIENREQFRKPMPDVFWPTLAEILGQIPMPLLDDRQRLFFTTVPILDGQDQFVTLGVGKPIQAGLTLFFNERQ